MEPVTNQKPAGPGMARWEIAAVVIMVLAAGLWYALQASSFPSSSGTQKPLQATVDGDQFAPRMPDQKLTFSPEVPAGAIPLRPDVAYTSPDEKTKILAFNVKAGGGAFTPSLITVRQGDRVQMMITAVDDNYDFALPAPIGAYLKAKQGETQILTFQADQPGTYVYMCERHCDGGKATGKLLVLPKT